MSKYAVLTQDNEIIRMVSCPERDKEKQAREGEHVLEISEDVSFTTHWVNSANEVKEKTELPCQVNKTTIIADGLDTASITGLPGKTVVRWHDFHTDTVNDGVVEFSVDLAGTYRIELISQKYFKKEITIEAVPAT